MLALEVRLHLEEGELKRSGAPALVLNVKFDARQAAKCP